MHELLIPDVPQIETWLRQAGHEFWMCDRCEGLHLSALQQLDGVLDSRLFVEPFGILFSTELDLKLSSVMKLNAELGRLNVSLPTMKLFMDVLDSGGALLVASDVLITTCGINYEQFVDFLAMTVDAKNWLLNECHELQVIFQGEHENSVHQVDVTPSLH